MPKSAREELEAAKAELKRLDALYTEELAKEYADEEEGIRRKTEDGKAWEDLFRAMPIDVSAILEHSAADAEKAKRRWAELEPRLQKPPADAQAKTRETLLLTERVHAALAGEHSPAWYFFHHAYTGNGSVFTHNEGGVTEGSYAPISWGAVNEMNPRAYAVGDGLGIADDNYVYTKSWLWFFVPGSYLPHPGTIYVWPYLDLHGYYWVRANDGFWTSKEARIRLRLCTRLYQYFYSPWRCWTVRDRGDDNIDESGRVDTSTYHLDARADLLVGAGDPVYVQVMAELFCDTEGSGSHALWNLQTGVGNYIRIPWIAVWTP